MSAQVAILAGGMGTRLKSRTGDLPKPMAPVMGRPVLEHQIDLCRRHGLTRIALLVHYAHAAISDHFGDGSNFGVQIEYHVEEEPRGTAGALRDALDAMEERFLVLYGDTYADIDLTAFLAAHASTPADATLLLHPNDHPQDSDLIALDDRGFVLGVHPYPRPEDEVLANLVNAALYIIERDAIRDAIPVTGRHDLAKHSFPAMLAAGLRIRGYVTPEYIKDMGTPERLDKVERDIQVGLPERLSTRHRRQAVFLDRDGVINREVQHLRSPEQIELLPGAGSSIRAINRAGRLAICVTNQPVVARGDVTFEGLAQIHARMEYLLGLDRAYIDRLYFCPHHPHRGYPGEVPELKIDCDCRKPNPGMLDQAVRELLIDRRHSWMIGDTTSDILAGRRAGLRTILVRTGHAGSDGKYPVRPDYALADLAAAVDWILTGHGNAVARLAPLVPSASNARLALIDGAEKAGKSSLAQVLAELVQETGRTVHVFSSDPAWRRGTASSTLPEIRDALLPILAGGRQIIPEALDSRVERDRGSIGPDDLIILEGMGVLADSALREAAELRLLVETDEAFRAERLTVDSPWQAPSETVNAPAASGGLEAFGVNRGWANHIVGGR